MIFLIIAEARRLAGAGIRSHLKNVFWPHIFVGASFQILDPPQANLRFATHKDYRIRREVPLGGETRPRRDLEPKSYF
jgi:hypothetical protein